MRLTAVIAAVVATVAFASTVCNTSYVGTTCVPSSGFVMGLQAGAQVVLPPGTRLDGAMATVTTFIPVPQYNYVFPTYRATLNNGTWAFAIPDFQTTCIDNQNHIAEAYSFPDFDGAGSDYNVTEVATVPAPKCPSCIEGPSCTVTLTVTSCV